MQVEERVEEVCLEVDQGTQDSEKTSLVGKDQNIVLVPHCYSDEAVVGSRVGAVKKAVA